MPEWLQRDREQKNPLCCASVLIVLIIFIQTVAPAGFVFEEFVEVILSKAGMLARLTAQQLPIAEASKSCSQTVEKGCKLSNMRGNKSMHIIKVKSSSQLTHSQ